MCPCPTGEYVHGVNSQWLEVDRVLAEQRGEQERGGGKKGKKADRQQRQGEGEGEDGEGGEGEEGGGRRGPLMEYLVKWKDLGYDQCT